MDVVNKDRIKIMKRLEVLASSLIFSTVADFHIRHKYLYKLIIL